MANDANQALRALRRARGWTQGDLAHALAAHLADLGINVSPDVRLIAAWESGEIRRPQAHYRQGLRAAFEVTSDAALGFDTRRTARRNARTIVQVLDTDTEDPVLRKQFLQGIAVLAFQGAAGTQLQPWLALERSRSVRTSLVGASDVSAVARTTAEFASWDMTRGGLLSVDAVMGQLNWAATLLDSATFATPQVRTAMFSAVAHLARVAGMSAYDAGLHADARRALSLGVHSAAEADDWPMKAFVLAGMARQEITLAHAQEAQDLVALASFGSREEATAPTRSMLSIVQARAHAALGQPQECLRAIGTAEDTYTVPGDGDPAWIGYYTPAQLAGDSGVALFDASAHDVRLRSEALDRLDRGAAQYGPQYPRSAAFCMARVSALHLLDGEIEEGARTGLQFAEVSAGIESARIREDRQMLVSTAAPLVSHQSVADLTEALTSQQRTA